LKFCDTNQNLENFFFLGEIIANKDKCNSCHGHKIISDNKSLEVVILPGCSNGKKIKFRGENDQLVSIFVLFFGEIQFAFSRESSQAMFLF